MQAVQPEPSVRRCRSDANDVNFESTSNAEWVDPVRQADYVVFNTGVLLAKGACCWFFTCIISYDLRHVLIAMAAGFHHHRRDMQFQHCEFLASKARKTLIWHPRRGIYSTDCVCSYLLDVIADGNMVRAVMSTMKQSFQGRKLFFLTTIWAHRFCNDSDTPYEAYSGSDGTFHWCVSFFCCLSFGCFC